MAITITFNWHFYVTTRSDCYCLTNSTKGPRKAVLQLSWAFSVASFWRRFSVVQKEGRLVCARGANSMCMPCNKVHYLLSPSFFSNKEGKGC